MSSLIQTVKTDVGNMESSEYYELAMCSQLGDEFDYFRGDNMHVEPEQGLRTFQADDPMDEHGENRFLSTKHASVPNDVSYDSGQFSASFGFGSERLLKAYSQVL